MQEFKLGNITQDNSNNPAINGFKTDNNEYNDPKRAECELKPSEGEFYI
jgi:hypothetical protein